LVCYLAMLLGPDDGVDGWRMRVKPQLWPHG
jgi:hypothetical protein